MTEPILEGFDAINAEFRRREQVSARTEHEIELDRAIYALADARRMADAHGIVIALVRVRRLLAPLMNAAYPLAVR